MEVKDVYDSEHEDGGSFLVQLVYFRKSDKILVLIERKSQ